MKVRSWFILPLCILSGAFAAGTDTCAVSGRVVNSATGVPVLGATVVLTGVGVSGGAGASTDAGGTFCISDVQAGRYSLEVQREGFVETRLGRRNGTGETLISVTEGETTATPAIPIDPEAAITGAIVDETAAPVASADVQVLEVKYYQGAPRLLPVWSGKADQHGRFKATGLAPGRYVLAAVARAVAPGRDASASMHTGVYTTSFYPGTSEPASAIPIDVRAGEEFPASQLTLRRVRAVPVRGKVISTVQETGGRTFVLLSPRGIESGTVFKQLSAPVGPDGTFELTGVAPGSYSLTAIQKQGNVSYRSFQDIEIGNFGVEDVRVTLTAGSTVSGLVRAQAGEQMRVENIRVYLHSGESLQAVSEGKVDNEGRFLIEHVAPGNYEVVITGAEENVFVKSALAGPLDVLKNGLSLNGEGTASLEIVLSQKSGEIQGLVTADGDKPVEASILLIPESRSGDIQRCRVARTSQDGTFQIRGLAPGRYAVAAGRRIETGLCQDLNFVQRFMRERDTLTIEESGRASIRLKLADPL